MSVYFILIYKLCLKNLLIYFILFEKKIFLFKDIKMGGYFKIFIFKREFKWSYVW